MARLPHTTAECQSFMSRAFVANRCHVPQVAFRGDMQPPKFGYKVNHYTIKHLLAMHAIPVQLPLPWTTFH